MGGCHPGCSVSHQEYVTCRSRLLRCPELFLILCDPGDTLYYRFTSDMSNTEWGYKFTVTAGHLGRFQTGVCAGPSVHRLFLGPPVAAGATVSLMGVQIKAETSTHVTLNVLWLRVVNVSGRTEELPVGTYRGQGTLQKGETENVLCCFYQRHNFRQNLNDHSCFILFIKTQAANVSKITCVSWAWARV